MAIINITITRRDINQAVSAFGGKLAFAKFILNQRKAMYLKEGGVEYSLLWDNGLQFSLKGEMKDLLVLGQKIMQNPENYMKQIGMVDLNKIEADDKAEAAKKAKRGPKLVVKKDEKKPVKK